MEERRLWVTCNFCGEPVPLGIVASAEYLEDAQATHPVLEPSPEEPSEPYSAARSAETRVCPHCSEVGTYEWVAIHFATPEELTRFAELQAQRIGGEHGG